MSDKMQGMVSSSLVAVAFGIGIGYYIAGRAMKAKPKDTRLKKNFCLTKIYALSQVVREVLVQRLV